MIDVHTYFHFSLADDENWTWNGDEMNCPSYFNWADGEPNLNPYPDTNYAQLQQDYGSGSDEPVGTWLVPGDQIDNYYFFCQSPKVPKSQVSTTNFQTTTPSQQDMTCMDGYEDLVLGSEKCYYVSYYDDMLSRDDATSACDAMMNWDYDVDYNSQNTELVSINSDDENDQLFSEMYAQGILSAWIGLSWNGKYTTQI